LHEAPWIRVGDWKARRRLSDRIESIKRFGRRGPQRSRPILEHEVEEPAGWIRLVRRIPTIRSESVAVVTVQENGRVQPEEPLIVLQDVADLPGRKTVPRGEMRKTDVRPPADAEPDQVRLPFASSGIEHDDARGDRRDQCPAFRPASPQ